MSTSSGKGSHLIQVMLEKIKAFYHAMSFISENFAPGEEAQLIKDYLATRSSWIDKLSAKWCGRSFWSKAAVILGATLFGGLIGLIAGSPILLSVLAGLISFTVHSLLISHENSRHADAKAFAKKSMAFNEALKKKAEAFQTAANNLSAKTSELNTVSGNLQQQVVQLDTQTKSIDMATQTLQQAVEEVTTATQELVQQEKIALDTLKELVKATGKSEAVVTQALEAAEGITASILHLGPIILEVKASQEAFSNAVSVFNESLNKPLPATVPSPSPLSPAESEDSDDVSLFIERLRKTNDTAEKVIQSQLPMVASLDIAEFTAPSPPKSPLSHTLA